MFRGKKYQESAKKIDKNALYDTNEAMSLVVETAPAKFDETVELHVKLGVDSRHADQQVRGAIVLPHGTGKTVRVLVFAKGDKADAAREAGADYVGDMDMVEKIQKENWFDFDVVIASPSWKIKILSPVPKPENRPSLFFRLLMIMGEFPSMNIYDPLSATKQRPTEKLME